MVEFSDLGSTATRKAIAELQAALLTTGQDVFGPSNYPILLPARTAEDLPVPHNMQDLTPKQWKEASVFFNTSGWLVPRIYALDQKSCVFRMFPKKSARFGPQIKKKVEAVLAQFKSSFDKVWRYSYDMGLTDQEHLSAINVNFGVQTANVIVVAKDRKLNDFARLEKISEKLFGYTDPRIRSKATMADFYHYMLAVQVGTNQPFPKIAFLGPRAKEIKALVEKCNMPSIVRSDGSTAVVLVSTDAEGQDNLDLCYNLAADLKVDETSFHPNR